MAAKRKTLDVVLSLVWPSICRGERIRTGRESPIRPWFVRDSFHTL